ncbi:MAG: hypothetical protein GXO73_12390 [Calditrichaeota bacterium]|nr:hypothetical protein [Calditrichota bacterium]
MIKLYFDFRDIFRSPRIALSIQRIWIQFVGLAVGYVGYLIFTYLAFLSAGKGLADMWEQWGLLPCLWAATGSVPWYSWIIYAVGLIILVVAWLIASTAVSRASYKLLKGDNFYTWREAYSFAFKKAPSVIMAPVGIALIALSFVIGAWVVGLLGRIPYVGELGLSLFTFVWLAAALFLFFLLIVTGVAFVIAPAVLATTDEDAFETIFQSFSVTWSQPWRFVVYQALSGLLTVVAFGILAWFVKQAFIIMNGLFGFSMGEKYINLASHGQYLVQKWVFLAQDWIQAIYGSVSSHIFFSHEFYALELPTVLLISAYIFAISLVIAGAWVVSYGLATFNVGNTLIYVIIRKKKDDENLLERKDREEEAEEEEKKTEELSKTDTGSEEKKDEEKKEGEESTSEQSGGESKEEPKQEEKDSSTDESKADENK